MFNPENSKDYIFEDTNIEWNTNDMTIKGELDNVKLDGKLSTQKIGYYDYYVLESSTGSIAFNCVFLPRGRTYSVDAVYVSSNNLKDLAKAIKKKNFSKISMKYEKNVGYVINKELIIKEQKAKEQLKNNIQTYGGVYKVIIKESLRGTRFKNQYGELYITEVGITLKTEISSMEMISGTYKIPNPKNMWAWKRYKEAGSKGMFAGNLDKEIAPQDEYSYENSSISYNSFSLSVNEDITAAVLKLIDQTVGGTRVSEDDTTMIMVEKISGLD
jgi:hypothetical protein